jgi:hypothetical protein
VVVAGSEAGVASARESFVLVVDLVDIAPSSHRWVNAR